MSQPQGSERTFVLPTSLVGRVEVSRLLREIEKIDANITAQAIRSSSVEMPAVSRVLEEVLQSNDIDIVDKQQRAQLVDVLKQIKETAPVLQVTFASSPEPDMTYQLVEWFRQNLHPVALITIGLQPALVGGCVVRTPDHIYDFSLRKQFQENVPMLTDEIRAVINKT